MKRQGPRTLPWGTPLITGVLFEVWPLTFTNWVRSERTQIAFYFFPHAIQMTECGIYMNFLFDMVFICLWYAMRIWGTAICIEYDYNLVESGFSVSLLFHFLPPGKHLVASGNFKLLEIPHLYHMYTTWHFIYDLEMDNLWYSYDNIWLYMVYRWQDV